MQFCFDVASPALPIYSHDASLRKLLRDISAYLLRGMWPHAPPSEVHGRMLVTLLRNVLYKFTMCMVSRDTWASWMGIIVFKIGSWYYSNNAGQVADIYSFVGD